MSKENKKYIVYKTTCLIDGSFYIGSHYGSNIENDSYLGSGKILSAKIKSRGRENFKRETLIECASVQEMREKEVLFISKHFNDPLNLNISKISGGGDLGKFKYKPILQYDSEGKLVREWGSVLELAKIMPFATKGRINSKYITGETDFQKLNCYGFNWIYKKKQHLIIDDRLEKSRNSIKEFSFNHSIKNKPLFCILMDVHISSKTVPLIEKLFDELIEECIKAKVRVIIQCGDIFDSRTGQPLDCLLLFKRILLKLEESGIHLISIPGNHDKTDLESEKSFLSVFDFHENFTLLEEENFIEWLHPLYNFCFIPYFKENGSFAERLSKLSLLAKRSKKKSLLFTHVAVNGVKNNDGTKVNNELSSKGFSEFENVYVAHYHNKSKVAPNINYLGSMYQANFGEDNKKGFHFMSYSGELTFHKLNFPEFVKFSVDAKSITSADIKDIQKIKEEHPERNIRIVLTGTEEEINSFNKSLLTDIGVSVDKKPSDVENLEPEEEIEIVSYNKDNLLPVFEEFCDYKNIEDRDYGRQLINKL